jgi:predicted lactoylglutathione lyase
VKVDDIRVFIPSKDYEISKSFYQALGFEMDYVTDDLALFENGDCSFFSSKVL